MKIKKDYIEQISKRTGANSEVADVVFSYLKKYKVDYTTKWGKRLSSAMLRKHKKQNLIPLMADVDERLDWIENILGH